LKIGITGGSGFIGTHVINALKAKHDIVVFDRAKPKIEGIKFVSGNIINDSTKEAFEKCDTVIHLAAAVGVKVTEEDPVLTLDTNILGTKNVLESCRTNKIRKMILASSSEVYGEPLKTPIEESDPVIPITNYGASKVAAEEYVKAYSTNFGIRYGILRFFNAYGPGQSKDFVMPEFVSKASENEPIVIHGSGSQIRAFCHVSDIANGISLAIDNGDNEIMNIGNDAEPITIFELAKKIVNITNSKSSIQFVPFVDSNRKRRKEIINRIPDIRKARRILSYEPRISLNDGIISVLKGEKHALSG
jgi:nucleoside-diphosphate-sugar epimerase